MTLEEILSQERTLTVSHFTNEDAWRMGVMARERVRALGLPVTLCVERCGQVAFQCAMEGSTPDNDRWMAGKREVVRLMHHSSLYAKEKALAKQKPQREGLGLDETKYLCVGGSVPITLEGLGVVGSLTVSGLKDTEDHDLAVDLVRRYLAANDG